MLRQKVMCCFTDHIVFERFLNIKKRDIVGGQSLAALANAKKEKSKKCGEVLNKACRLAKRGRTRMRIRGVW